MKCTALRNESGQEVFAAVKDARLLFRILDPRHAGEALDRATPLFTLGQLPQAFRTRYSA